MCFVSHFDSTGFIKCFRFLLSLIDLLLPIFPLLFSKKHVHGMTNVISPKLRDLSTNSNSFCRKSEVVFSRIMTVSLVGL